MAQIALAMLDQVSPDIVTLDVEMPVMDGLETLKAIRSQRKNLPVIMFSTTDGAGSRSNDRLLWRQVQATTLRSQLT